MSDDSTLHDELDQADQPVSADQLSSADGPDATDELDLDRIDADLAGVERALRRLDDGSYWTDEATGAPLDPAVLEADPIATATPGGPLTPLTPTESTT